jgi:hypothetical protein
MRPRNLLCLALVVCSLWIIGGVSAQGDFTDEEIEWLEIVSDAFESTTEAESYSAEIEQSIEQTITSGSGSSAVEITNTIDQVLNLEVELTDDGFNYVCILEQAVSSEIGGQTTEIELTLELVSVDGDFYARATDVSPSSLSSNFPDDWIDVNEDGSRYPSIAVLNAEQPGTLYNAIVDLEVSDETVVAIEEVDSEELDDQEMRVFEIEYDTEAMLQSDAMASIVDALTGMMQGSDIQDILDQMAEGSSMNFIVWIGADDGLVHQVASEVVIDADLEVSGAEVTLEQTLESVAQYSEFGEDFDIEAPDL